MNADPGPRQRDMMMDKRTFISGFLYLAYWNLYTDMLEKEEEDGCHILPFGLMSLMGFAFTFGVVIFFELTSGCFLSVDVGTRVIIHLLFGAVLTYLHFVRGDKFKRAKELLASLNLEDQKWLCKECGLITALLGMTPFFLVWVVGFIYAMR